MVVQRGFFDLDARYAALSAAGDPLEKLSALIDFEIFRPALDAALQRSDGSKGGRPPMDAVMMFKTLVLQTLYGLSDAQTEFQILDRRSFGRFLGLDDGDNTPDETTIWRFHEALVRADAIDALFVRFDAHLKSLGYLAMGGQIVDASIVQAPLTQANKDEREALNEGRRPEGWSAKRLQHTDRDARWTKKHGKSFYGYKVHANADARYKLIRQAKVTPANADDGQTLKEVLDRANTGARLLADRGYDAQTNRELLQAHGLRDGIARRAKPGQERRVRLDARNKAINRVRARGEHVFAGLEQLGGKCVRAMTLARNELAILLKCAAYNAKRLVWLVRHDPCGCAR